VANGGAPPEIRWENHVSDFLDQLVDSDVRYLDVHEAIERHIHSGLRERIAVDLGLEDLEGEIVYWHPLPLMFPEMRQLHAFWMMDDDGGLTVILVDFA
jgi:hypothetical protein